MNVNVKSFFRSPLTQLLAYAKHPAWNSELWLGLPSAGGPQESQGQLATFPAIWVVRLQPSLLPFFWKVKVELVIRLKTKTKKQ